MPGPFNNPLAGVAKHAGDIGSVGVILASIADWFPSIASLLSIVWFLIRIYESRTVQGLLGRKGQHPPAAGD